MSSAAQLESLLFVGPANDARFLRFFEDVRRDLTLDRVPQHHTITVYGRQCHPTRRTQFYTDFRASTGYSYSKSSAFPVPLLGWMRELLKIVNEEFKQLFNSVLVNIYCSGADTIAAHCDKDISGENGVVAISFGSSRKFRIREKASKLVLKDLQTEHAQVLMMKTSKFQELYTHEIPAGPKTASTRWSLTFRKLE
jgi:alkylated DNA repair dioxygenase AlkB